ncbi:MAG: alpha/beta fold hydrolase [Candidatus Promineifilaceae bacterium]
MTENDGPELIENGPAYEASGLVHRVLVPEGKGPFSTGPHPTAVMIHGRSGNEDVMWVFRRALPKDWLVVAPRAIQDDPDGGYSWHPRQKDEWPSLGMFDEAVSAVVKFIKALPELYGADPEHIYLMGFSQGAATAFATAIRHPGLVKAVAGLVGFMPFDSESEVAPGVLDGLPVFMAVGLEDDTIPLALSRHCADALRTAGADLIYGEYETGHKLNAQGMRELKAWWGERDGE